MNPDRRRSAVARGDRAGSLRVQLRHLAWLAWIAAWLQLLAPVLGHAAAYTHATPLGAVCTSAGAAQEGSLPSPQHACQACITCAAGPGAVPLPASLGPARTPVAATASPRAPGDRVVRVRAHWPDSQPRAPPAVG